MLSEAAIMPAMTGDEAWPAEVALIISSLEAGSAGMRATPAERRAVERMNYRVRGKLRLLVGGSEPDEKTLYVRDVNHRGLGFVAPHLLPLGYGGVVRLMAPDGIVRSILCTLLRCRRVAAGWYEGTLHFHREQAEFAVPGFQAESAD